MKLLNIYNHKRTLYLFCRDENGQLFINKETGFFPYYYEPFGEGMSKSYTGIPLKKIIVSQPGEVPKQRTDNAWEADILFTRRYMIDRVKTIDKCPIKYAFMDIEVLSDELPDKETAPKPVSCITIYNSFTKLYHTFYLGDYESEFEMIKDFIDYLQKEKFDIILAWNMANFDFPYLYHRYTGEDESNFSDKISPINKSRYGDGEIFYPAGTSIIDYLSWFKKVTLNKEQEYSLDYISQKYLKRPPKAEVSFSELSEELKQHNIEDVKCLVELEEKKKLIPYFDEIRRLAKVEWEDMIWNSRVIDMLLLEEAKNQHVVLPMRPIDNEKEEFEGAYREAFKTGAFYNIGKYDLGSAYPTAIIDFCLDPANIKHQKEKECLEIEGTYFKQNAGALLPTVANKLITLKTEIKKKLSTLTPETPEHKDMKQMYDAIKTVVNSAYGVMGNRFFRLYDKRVASATTFIVRSILKYVKEKVEEQGYEVIYVDTDSVFIQSDEDLTELLNDLVQEWGQVNFGKEKINIEFDYEGIFEKILILTKCRYIGYIDKGKGIEEEIKGVEAKRKDSTKFMKKFHRELMDKILNKVSKDDIMQWIKLQILKLQQAPLEDIAFPCKRASKEYKNKPIFIRALENSSGFDKKIGEPYYYIYVIPESYEIKEKEATLIQTYNKDGLEKGFKNLTPKRLETAKEVHGMGLSEDELIEKGIIKTETVEVKGKARDVMAFDAKKKTHIHHIDWDKMIDRNIYMKLDTIFEAMGWDIGEVK